MKFKLRRAECFSWLVASGYCTWKFAYRCQVARQAWCTTLNLWLCEIIAVYCEKHTRHVNNTVWAECRVNPVIRQMVHVGVAGTVSHRIRNSNDLENYFHDRLVLTPTENSTGNLFTCLINCGPVNFVPSAIFLCGPNVID
jgi:hypothetical protein